MSETSANHPSPEPGGDTVRGPYRGAAPGARDGITISRMTAADVPRCVELERVLFPTDDPWNADAFEYALGAGHYYVVARDADRVVGYAGLARVGFDAEVHTLAVDPAYQGRGIGRALLRELLDKARGATVFLEVRTDNLSAIRLYRSEGFMVIGTRRNYYRPSGADALTMRREAVS